MNGLEPGTEYSACVIAKNAVGSRAGSSISFTTKAIPPKVVSVAVVGQPASSEATIEGHVLPGAQHAKCELEYGPTEAYGIRVPCNDLSISSADSGATASVHVTGLEPGAAYDYRLILENASGLSAPGEGQGTFTTQTATPLLSVESASEVGSSGALLSAHGRPRRGTHALLVRIRGRGSVGSEHPRRRSVRTHGRGADSSRSDLRPDTGHGLPLSPAGREQVA